MTKQKLLREDYRLKYYYGISSLDYFRMQLEQDNACAICKKPETEKHRSGKVAKLTVDHCHETGKIRGLLCTKCNKALGMFADDIGRLAAAIAYLKGET